MCSPSPVRRPLSSTHRARAAPSQSWEPALAVPGTDPLPDTVAEALQGDRDAWLAEAGRVGATAAVGAELVPGAAMAQSRIGKTFTAAHVMALGRSALLQDEGSR